MNTSKMNKSGILMLSMSILLVLAIVVGTTLGAFSSSATATGTITFRGNVWVALNSSNPDNNSVSLVMSIQNSSLSGLGTGDLTASQLGIASTYYMIGSTENSGSAYVAMQFKIEFVHTGAVSALANVSGWGTTMLNFTDNFDHKLAYVYENNQYVAEQSWVSNQTFLGNSSTLLIASPRIETNVSGSTYTYSLVYTAVFVDGTNYQEKTLTLSSSGVRLNLYDIIDSATIQTSNTNFSGGTMNFKYSCKAALFKANSLFE